MRLMIALVATLFLSGCFMSQTALYQPGAGACPFTETTSFTISQVDAGGAYARAEAFTIRPQGRLCARTTTLAGAEAERALFIPLEAGWFVMQREPSPGQDGYLYQLAHIEGDAIRFYVPNCADFTAAALAEFGVEIAQMPALNPAAPEAPARLPKSTDMAKQNGADQSAPALICNPPTAQSLERTFRAWITLNRPPDEFGDRVR